MTEPELYKNIIAVVSDYLGPAADRFIDRQIENHLQKEPAQLTHKDLPLLIDWVRVSVAFLTEDRKLIDDLTTRLRELERGGQPANG